jgi:hypothetical protein
MKYLGIFLTIIFVVAMAGACYFWPPGRDQRSNAFFSLLQFLAASGLILLTFLYVRAVRDQLATDNRPPVIVMTEHHFPDIDPFSLSLRIQIANPSSKATSVAITSVKIGQVIAREVHFEFGDRLTQRITVAARDLRNVTLRATNFDPPGIPIELGRKTDAVLVFNDVFHGDLSPICIKI